jgi:NDP-sugar pyrophosphorylase family protein
VSDPLTAVVLAGGEGTRLRPLTDDLPKPMLPVLNRPFLDFLIERLVSVGVTKIILAVGYKPEPLVERYGRGQGFGVEIDYTVEDSPLGTSGAVRAVLPQLTETFLVLNGDVVTSVDLRSMIDEHVERREFATIAIHEEDDPSRFGVVQVDGEGFVMRFLEKPKGPRFPSKLVNSGVYVLEPEALRFVPEDGPSMFETDLFPNMLRMNMMVHSYMWDGYFLDMGTAESYLAVNRDFLSGKAPAWHDPTSDVMEGDGASVSPSATVTGPTVLGPGCVIEDGATVEGSVLWSDVRVGRNARVRGAVLGNGVNIDSGATIEDGSILTNP